MDWWIEGILVLLVVFFIWRTYIFALAGMRLSETLEKGCYICKMKIEGKYYKEEKNGELKIICTRCHNKLVSSRHKKAFDAHFGVGPKTDNQKNDRYISSQVKNDVWRRDRGRCSQCGSNEKLEYDHIIPFSKGGSNTARNIQLLCESCNRMKNNKI